MPGSTNPGTSTPPPGAPNLTGDTEAAENVGAICDAHIAEPANAGLTSTNPHRSRNILTRGCREGQYESSVPTIADRVVQAALKLVLEPIFEADFLPVSYGFRPERRAHDAVADIHRLGTQGYLWVLDADI